jgi:autotransporter-associated beta strand protein
MAGASLTIVGGSLGPGTVAGGIGGINGQAFGGGLFLQGNEAITLAPPKGTTETISGVIADQTGSGGAGADAGAGSLTLNGAGTLDLSAANTFTGGVTIDKGVLVLRNASAAGSGAIDFASASGEVKDAAGANLANTISGLGGKDRIDFAQVAFASGDHAVDNAGSVSIKTSAGVTVATFKVSGSYATANFHVGKDASGHVLVTYAPVAASGAVIGSAADILGGFAPEFAEPLWTQESMSAFDSWATLTAGAGTDPGGFGSHGENNGTVGGAHDAWGVGWTGSTGHGPGSGA